MQAVSSVDACKETVCLLFTAVQSRWLIVKNANMNNWISACFDLLIDEQNSFAKAGSAFQGQAEGDQWVFIVELDL